jgi:hypothetical protein
MDENATITQLDLTSSELELIRTALEMLEDTLGREEAEELAEVQALLARLPRT